MFTVMNSNFSPYTPFKNAGQLMDIVSRTLNNKNKHRYMYLPPLLNCG